MKSDFGLRQDKRHERHIAFIIAIILIGFYSCTRGDHWEEPEHLPGVTPPARKVYVKVGASMDLVQTEVDKDGNTIRTLNTTFQPNDRIYVYGIPRTDAIYRIVGYLNMVDGSLSKDGKYAEFQGDLLMYKGGGPTDDLPFGTSTVLNECHATAFYIPSTMTEGFYNDNVNFYDCDYTLSLTIGDNCVENLTRTALRIASTKFDSEKYCFTTFLCDPIFDFTLSGVTNGDYRIGMTESMHNISEGSAEASNMDNFTQPQYKNKVSFGSDGIKHFAVSKNMLAMRRFYHLAISKDKYETEYFYQLGMKELEYNKIYQYNLPE